ncbi:MAG: flavin reductase family protein [Proteobacteria bacterium]|nr:flavin reductase family protein [Burkholderiales bacterium]
MTRLDLIGDSAQRQLRDAFGRFATGVTVITGLLHDGRRTGLTVNSFTSLSLEPAMILWNLRSGSPSEAAFETGRAFAVNVLATGQQEISQRFCRPAEDKFAGLDVDEGIDGVPLLGGSLAAFECRVENTVTCGDHRIVIGRVLTAHYGDGEPLIYSQGRYCTAAGLAA